MIRYFFERFVDLIRYLIRFITSFFRDTSDPVGDVLKFIANFERSFGTQHPEFYQGSYSQAIKDAKKELRFLLIYLHNPHSVEAQDFCTNVLTHNEVINYLTRNRIFFWACSTDSSEGYKVLQSLRENTFPLLALVTLVDNQMTVVEKFVGNTSVERFLSRLQRGIEDNEVSLITARLEREERDMNRMLREEQDKAYEESLRADQEKDRKKAEERKRKENEEREKNEREMNEIKKREQLIKLKLELAGKIPSEPSPTDPNAMRLMIKFPDGSRLERRFRKSDSVMSLYYFVFCQDASPLKFQMTTNFPRRELPGRPPSLDDPLWNSQAASNGTAEPLPSLESLGLKKAEVLFVNDLEA